MPTDVMFYIIAGAVALVFAVIGFVSGSLHRRKSAEASIGSAEDEARRIDAWYWDPNKDNIAKDKKR